METPEVFSVNRNVKEKIKRSNVMKNSTIGKYLGRGILAILTLALVATVAMGQNLVIGGTPTFTGAGIINVKGAINNSVVASISGVVNLTGTAAQTIGTTGALTFSTLNVNTTVGAASLAVSTAVNTALLISASSTLNIQDNTLSIGGTSTRNVTGVLTAGGTSTVNFTSGAAQDVMPNSYANLGLSGAGIKTFPVGTTTVNTSLTASSDITTTGTLAFAAAATGTISGALVNNGTFTAPTTGLITFNGAVAQGISGTNPLTFTALTLSGAGVKNADVNISVGGQLTVDQTLNMLTAGNRLLTMLNSAAATQPIYGSLMEVTGRMQWQAFAAQSYTFNNALTVLTFSAADPARTFELNVQPATAPSSYIAVNTVNREIHASYAAWLAGTANMQLAYQHSEADASLNQTRLKEFHGAVTSANKLVGTISRLGSIAGSLGWVKHTLLPIGGGFTSGEEIQLDNHFSTFISIASTAWNLSTTWDAADVPISTDDVEIAPTFAVNIPTGYAATALSVLIDAGATGGLTLDGNATLTVGAGGITNNNIAPGAGLNVAAGTGVVTINLGNLTNNGLITNAGTITVQ